MLVLKYALIAVAVLGLIAVGGLFYLGQSSQGASPPGLVDGRLAPCPDSPNCVSSEAGTASEKQVDTLPLDAWADIPTAITDKGGVIVTEEADYIAAEFKSGIFGFVDDVEFRKDESSVQVRSASRVGYSDNGVNKARVADLRAALGK